MAGPGEKPFSSRNLNGAFLSRCAAPSRVRGQSLARGLEEEKNNRWHREVSTRPILDAESDTGRGLLGFHRLAIMGLTPAGMQPFRLGNSFLVCNGEIYGFETLREMLKKKGYTFHSDSDCEILLPLYREYGTGMFSMLDAEFACIIYDGEKGSYLAARDPIGIRPLYYGYDPKGTILFASEAKNLVGLAGRIMPFPFIAIVTSPGRIPIAGTIWKQSAGISGKSSSPGWKSGWYPTPRLAFFSPEAWIPPWCAPSPPEKQGYPSAPSPLGCGRTPST